MTQNTHSESKVYVTLELSNKEWKLAFGDGRQARQVNMPARNVVRFWTEVAKAKEKFGLPAEAKVYSCYEAGRDGFWIHRMLQAGGAENLVVDPASIEVNRRAKRVKTDRLDAAKLLQMLLRYHLYGEKKTWSVVRVPSEAEEDQRRPHRLMQRLKKERRAYRCRIKSLLALHGITLRRWLKDFSELKDWKQDELPTESLLELKADQERLALAEKQLADLEELRKQKIQQARQQGAEAVPAQKWGIALARIKGVGEETAWNLAHEFFGWRVFQNRREVGAASGLVGSPYDSGDSRHEQGISKAGNARVRHWMTELAWRWLQFQSQSALAKWYQRRFGSGSGRMRRIGIVALARKLLIALWRYGTEGVLPEAAVLKA